MLTPIIFDVDTIANGKAFEVKDNGKRIAVFTDRVTAIIFAMDHATIDDQVFVDGKFHSTGR